MEFITNQKGGQSLLWDVCRFTLNIKLDNGTCYWRCHKRSCAARITTLGTDILQQTNRHTHAVNPERVRAKKSKVVRHEETIKKLMEEFTGGIRTLKSFLSSLSHCVVSFDY